MISLGFGRDFREGMFLPRNDQNVSMNLEEFIEAGKVEEVEVQEDPKGNVVAPPVTGNEVAPGPSSKEIDTSKKWNYNPDELDALDLETLNLRVMETDPRVGPFDSVGEAIAQLSADFNAPPAPPAKPSSRKVK